MNDSFRNGVTLVGLKLNRLALQIDDEFALKDEEELILLIVFVPVKFSLHHP